MGAEKRILGASSGLICREDGKEETIDFDFRDRPVDADETI